MLLFFTSSWSKDGVEFEMALETLFLGLFLLFQHVAGSTYLFSRGSGDVTILQCPGAGSVNTLCTMSNFSAETATQERCAKGKSHCDNIGPENKTRKQNRLCQKCKLTGDKAFAVKPDRSMVFTCAVQDSSRRAKGSKCPSWTDLTREGCENHDLFFVITLSDSDEVFSTDENPSSLSVSEGVNVTLPCLFENKKSQPFTLFWITPGKINQCLHSVHIEDYKAHSNTRCCVDRELSQRISTQSSHSPTNANQTHNLTIHSVTVMDTGRYLCVVHAQVSGKPVWKIAANISLTVTQTTESPETHTSTSGISSVTSSGTHTNSDESNSKNKPVIIAIVCVVALICIVGVICIIRRKRQMGKGSSAPGQRDGDVQLTQEDECLPYSVFPRKEQTDENEHVAYAVTSVPTALSQPRPGEGQGTYTTSAATEHVYCLIDESAVKSDGDKTETQGAKCKDQLNHGRQVETSPAIELNDQSPLKEQDPVVSSDDQAYSWISYPETGSVGNTVTQSHLEENDPKHGPLKMEENPIYSETGAPELNQL
ncbi:uncharacterized protein [Scyliorhinus torazame]|uniref:uncharacterized protein isoform X2 n=1 Tax=Scyliorhinus torazame TaxID=75743 RepID=UPI003B5965A1